MAISGRKRKMRPGQLNNNRADDFIGKNIKQGYFNRFLLLFFISAAVFSQTSGITQLPDSYRTPLSDMTYDSNKEWRTPPEEDNPWRENQKELEIKPRIKASFFPEYDYNTVDDPTTRSLFQNEYELERPRTNIFKYTF